MSTLSWNRLLSFCSLNLSIKLFPLCSLNISSTAVECRMVVFSKTQIFVATEYSKPGICIAMNERTVIIVSYQSSYVCCASCTCSYDNHRKCTCRVHYCLAVFQTLFFAVFMHYLPKTWGLNQNSKHVGHQVKPFSFTLPKIADF